MKIDFGIYSFNVIDEGLCDGVFLVLLYVFGMGVYFWEDMIEYLFSGFRIICFDMCGYCDSMVFEGVYKMGSLVCDVEWVLD